jgi:hypothetical protein
MTKVLENELQCMDLAKKEVNEEDEEEKGQSL